MSSSLISSIDSKDLESEKLDIGNKVHINPQILSNERAMSKSKPNEKILLIKSSMSHRVKSRRLKINIDNDEEDEFWIDSGKTKLGIQFERYFILGLYFLIKAFFNFNKTILI